jgi:hypothetical protein
MLEHFAHIDSTRDRPNLSVYNFRPIWHSKQSSGGEELQLQSSDEWGVHAAPSKEPSLAKKLWHTSEYLFLVYLMVGYIFLVSSALEPWACVADVQGRMHMKADPSILCQWCPSTTVVPDRESGDSYVMWYLNNLEYRVYATIAVIAASICPDPPGAFRQF